MNILKIAVENTDIPKIQSPKGFQPCWPFPNLVLAYAFRGFTPHRSYTIPILNRKILKRQPPSTQLIQWGGLNGTCILVLMKENQSLWEQHGSWSAGWKRGPTFIDLRRMSHIWEITFFSYIQFYPTIACRTTPHPYSLHAVAEQSWHSPNCFVGSCPSGSTTHQIVLPAPMKYIDHPLWLQR